MSAKYFTLHNKHFTVLNIDNNHVVYQPYGGGDVRTLSSPEKIEIVDKLNTEYQESYFNLLGGKFFKGKHDPSYDWNGHALPMFHRSVIERQIIPWFKECLPNFSFSLQENGNYIITETDVDGEVHTHDASFDEEGFTEILNAELAWESVEHPFNNHNCLEGIACPNCHEETQFTLTVKGPCPTQSRDMTNAQILSALANNTLPLSEYFATFTDEGGIDTVGDIEFVENKPIRCRSCDHHGLLEDFYIENFINPSNAYAQSKMVQEGKTGSDFITVALSKLTELVNRDDFRKFGGVSSESITLIFEKDVCTISNFGKVEWAR